MPLNSTDLLEEGGLKEAEFMAKRWSLEQVKKKKITVKTF